MYRYVVRNTKKYSNNIIIRYYIIRQCQKNVATTIYVFLFQNLDSALLTCQPFQGGVDENHLVSNTQTCDLQSQFSFRISR